jgi:sulfate transport system ATP-binding protein
MAFPTQKVSFLRQTAALALMHLAAAVSGIGDALLRPREVHLIGEPDGVGTEALVVRIVRLGSELRVELRLGDGATIWGRLSREEAEELELRDGQIVAVRLLGEVGSPRPALARAA